MANIDRKHQIRNPKYCFCLKKPNQITLIFPSCQHSKVFLQFYRKSQQVSSKRPMKHFIFTTYFWVNSSGILLIISNSYERMRNIYSVVSTFSGRTTQRKIIIKLINFVQSKE